MTAPEQRTQQQRGPGRGAVQQCGGQREGGYGGESPDQDQPGGGGSVALGGQGAEHAGQPQQVGNQGEMRALEGGEGVAQGVLPQHDRQDGAQHHEGACGVPRDEQADGGEQAAQGG